MLELQKTVTQITKIRDYYRVKINETAPFCPPMTVPPVVIALNDYNCLNKLLQKLIAQLQQFSPSLAQSIANLHSKLYIYNNNLAHFNPFHFGALSAMLDYISSKDFICNFAKYIITPWEDVNEALTLFLETASTAKNRLEYNQVGVTAREIYILLAQKVYKEEMNNNDGQIIGPTDTKEMLKCYIDYVLAGRDNEKLRHYSDSAIKLAESVTHMKTEDKKRMDVMVAAVINVVALINNIYSSQS